jgi:hypothetical protein
MNAADIGKPKYRLIKWHSLFFDKCLFNSSKKIRTFISESKNNNDGDCFNLYFGNLRGGLETDSICPPEWCTSMNFSLAKWHTSYSKRHLKYKSKSDAFYCSTVTYIIWITRFTSIAESSHSSRIKESPKESCYTFAHQF